MKMDLEAMQPETASSVASAYNFTQQTEGAASTNGGKKTSWVWMYFIRLREECKAVCQVPKLRGRSEICRATYLRTAMNSTNNLAKHLMSKHQIHNKIPEQGAMRAFFKSEYMKVCASHKFM